MFQICPQSDAVGDPTIKLKKLPGLDLHTLQDFDSALKYGVSDASCDKVVTVIEANLEALFEALPDSIEEFEESPAGSAPCPRPRKKRSSDVLSILFGSSNLTDDCMQHVNDMLKHVLEDIVGDLDVELRSHGTSIIDANPGALKELGLNRMDQLLGQQFTDFLTDESKVVFDNKVSEFLRTDTELMREFTLNFETDGRRLYANTRMSFDRDLGLDGSYLPMVICRLFPRPIWVDVQNGPVLLTFRDAEVKQTYGGS